MRGNPVFGEHTHYAEIDPEVFYPPGAMFLTRIPSRTGWWVGLAQALLGMPSRWTHAGIIGPGGRTYEAHTRGVHEGHVDNLQGKAHIVSDAPIQYAVAAMRNMDTDTRKGYEAMLRSAVVFAAHELVGTPYSFLDYLALALWHLWLWWREHMMKPDTPQGRSLLYRVAMLVRRRVEDSGHLICSAFADRVYDHAGVHLYDDDRLSGDVTPSDLDAWIDDHPLPVRS